MQQARTDPRPGVGRGRGKRVLILTASAGSGHNAAAAALEHHARASSDVEEVRTLDVLELTGDLYRRVYDNAYFRLVNAVPWVVGWSYDSRDAPVLVRYQLRRDVPTLLISACAAGCEYAHAVVAQTLRMRNSFQAVVVCGPNEQLKADMTGLVADEAERYRVLGYTTDMPDLMRVATRFIGKPGGLSSSECMAAGLAMALVNPIPGQEVHNSYFLLEEGVAVHAHGRFVQHAKHLAGDLGVDSATFERKCVPDSLARLRGVFLIQLGRTIVPSRSMSKNVTSPPAG